MEIQSLSTDEELKHLFTKTLIQDDMLDLTFVGDSIDYLANLPTPIYNEIITKGLQIRMHPPNQRLVTIYYDNKSKSFKLQKNDWLAIVKESGLEVGDRIACWACCHDLGGNFSLLIEKVGFDQLVRGTHPPLIVLVTSHQVHGICEKALAIWHPLHLESSQTEGPFVKHLFTKTIIQDDMLGLALVGDSNNYFRGLPKPMLDEIGIKGLEIEIYTPNNKSWVAIYYDRENKNFKLEKIAWFEVALKSGFKIGDTIGCWSLYHGDLGPYGILALLIEKQVPIDIDNEGGGQQARVENAGDSKQ
ncbi:unnamed protein product [Dovyalis caffra]|uniref:Uncharacterized protein n=1 Tax=Dovyalis caffra TaxID=77055 RepID=A0AAV1RVI4_9ROSI|nr:unnamed protein product [Dovyalis caffra]